MIAQTNNIKIAAVVILYQPDEGVVQNIESYYSFVNKLYVFDNTEKVSLKVDWEQYPKIEYHHDGKNRGIAERLNTAAEWAISAGYHWMLTMDQDSVFSNETLQQYLSCFRNFEGKETIALFGPTHSEAETGSRPGCEWVEAERIITSGALLNLSVFPAIGKFDEALFIDSVDCDYCIRANLNGHKVIQFSTIVMQHQLGTYVYRSSIKTLFLKKKKKAVHSPLRAYYMLRNLLYLKKKYKNQDLPAVKEIEHEVSDRIKRYFFYGRNSRKLFKYLLLAYKDFTKGKMGKLDK